MVENESILGKIEISKPSGEVQKLWKYFDLHRFIYLITQRKLFFTRLDFLDDPFEGISTSFLRTETVVNEFWKMVESNPNTEEAEVIDAQKKLIDYIKKEKRHIVNQSKQYANCWFLCQRESMAMWNLYCNEDSVAIKVNFDKIEQELTHISEKLIEENGNRLSVIGDQVTYMNLNPFDTSLKSQKLKFSAMKKDTSFSHEKEYRFLIYTAPLDEQPNSFEIQINIDDLDLEIISHPNMSDWKFKNLENLIMLTGIKVKLIKSATVVKNYR